MKKYETKKETDFTLNLSKFNAADQIRILNALATRDAANGEICAVKDEVIEGYKRAAEAAIRSKHRALARKEERRKDIFAWAVLTLAIAASVLLIVIAGHEFLLWASGR